jgi:hypothetical protein
LPNHADIQDVNGTAWLNSSTLIYSVSPINNENPGIFSYGCTTRKTTTIKSGKGTPEYMELARIGRDKFIYLYYAPDVDKVDFGTLRQPQNLYRIRINGTGFSISPARHK